MQIGICQNIKQATEKIKARKIRSLQCLKVGGKILVKKGRRSDKNKK